MTPEENKLFMSLIHTCELNDTNPFHYRTELQKHAAELAKSPAHWSFPSRFPRG